ncbi:helix-turn-helix transcriptional regulator [Shewanella sp. TC10]|uniref:helix-turn-helix transcriptional regulator n=1 Tax=Shewanella sp. TC10 TaxID=1419739 RepID=UPI001892B53B|nr:hypothetical protein [Shewanella sp. TC10]
MNCCQEIKIIIEDSLNLNAPKCKDWHMLLYLTYQKTNDFQIKDKYKKITLISNSDTDIPDDIKKIINNDTKKLHNDLVIKVEELITSAAQYKVTVSLQPQYSLNANIIINAQSLMSNNKEIIEKSEGWIRYIAFKIVNELQLPLQLNHDLDIISTNLIRVINLLSKGLNRGEAAKELNMTERGIDYHLELGKQKLNSPNISSLVFKINKMGCVNNDITR